MPTLTAFGRVLRQLRQANATEGYGEFLADIRSLDGRERGAILAEIWGGAGLGRFTTRHSHLRFCKSKRDLTTRPR